MSKRTQSVSDRILSMTSAEWSMENLSSIPERELRQMYSQQRDIMRKRIDRLEKSGYGDSGILDRFKLAPKLSTLKDKESVVKELKEMHRFIDMRTSTVSGQKEAEERFRKSMEDVAGKPLSSDDAKKLSRLMSKVGNAIKDKALKYKVVQQMQAFADARGIKNAEKFFKDINFWAKNIDKLDELNQIRTPSGRPSQSSAAYRRAINFYDRLDNFTGK